MINLNNIQKFEKSKDLQIFGRVKFFFATNV
jgi:hypothetical protein